MRIIIVGCGKVGLTIARKLSEKKAFDVTVVDIDPDVFGDLSETLDVIFVAGNGASERVLLEAGAKGADLIICTTNSDELNILCCIIAERIGTKHSTARVRNPDYSSEYNKLWKEFGIDLVINPEQQTAREISRLLRYPSTDGLNTFVSGRVEMISFKVTEASDFLTGKSVSQVFNKKTDLLAALVERNNNAVIPDGNLIFEESDVVHLIGRPSNIINFFILIGKKPKRTQNIMIIGGGKITYYLTGLLARHTIKTNIKIIEKDRERCEVLDKILPEINPRCLIIHGNGTGEALLASEDIDQMDAFICLMGIDEENAITSLYAKRMGVKKIINKINHINPNMIMELGLKNIIMPKNIISDFVFRYIEGLAGAEGSAIGARHIIFSGNDGTVESVEFGLNKKASYLDVPMRDLKLKKGVLIGCVIQGADIVIPTGKTKLQQGDRVIIIAKNHKVNDFNDIIAH
ncbi:MAG: Trk system potassium transporter TrkA [Oscillospiraceae bacterium]|nr:Trk system potassium transporter TrkA [Oscillospiraceae bacterium]